MLSKYRDTINAFFEKIAAHFKFLPPNAITVSSLLFSFVPAYLFYLGMVQIASILVLLSGGFDVMDGAVARLTDRVTLFGGFLDSTFDRMADFIILGGIALSGIVGWELVLFTAFGSFMVPYCRARGEAAGCDQMAVGIAERAERQLVLVAGGLIHPLVEEVNILQISVAILGILAWITVFQRIIAAKRCLEK